MPSNLYVRITFVLVSVGIYALIFFLLYPIAGSATAALTIIPIVIAGWLLGARGGLVFGFITFPLNNLLLGMVRDPNAGFSFSNWLVVSVFTLIGMAVGWARGLVDRVDQQTKELDESRKALQERIDAGELLFHEMLEEMEKRIQAEERLSHEALHDPLTGLPNRRLFASRLEHAVEWNKRNPNDLFAVIYLDFDRFKVINDSLGHNVGDQLLIGLAQRLKLAVRAMDTVARMGGDEFAILLEAFKNDDEVIMIVKRLQATLAAPFEAEGNSIVMTASIGIVGGLLRYEQIDDIVRDADIAMYSAKVSGKNRYAIFDVSMRQQADTVMKLESGLRNAIQNEEFRLHYQPIFSLKAQRLTGFEAVLRWQHPERGLLYPADFMRAAEESGLIVPIGHWVLREACQQMKQWQMQFKTEPPLSISINLSGRQFAQSDLVQQIESTLKETSLPAESLFLQVTEMTLIGDIEKAVTRIEQLRALGVGIEIDDFGTAYSSLGYLRHLPVNNLKIDRSFISTLGASKSGVPIIRAIIAMANSLDMKVIAEGIETAEQMKNLIQMECEYGQGFLFNTPVDGNAAQKLIKERLAEQKAQQR
ncbi:MAG: bifunctional diguanylate cyclase/phosphodiesterase [Chloroflexota bacterium]